jgi:hypothetical protein
MIEKVGMKLEAGFGGMLEHEKSIRLKQVTGENEIGDFGNFI